MGSGFPTQNYWPQLQMCEQHYVYEEERNPKFQSFMKPIFSNPTPRSQFGSNNRLRERNILRPENCLQFKRGHCKYGANCMFFHIPTLENNTSFDCSEEGQDMIHRGRICYRGKECLYGDRCRFLHIRENVSVTLVNSDAEDYRMGFNGMKRRRSENSGSGGRHMEQKNVVWRKTKLCMKWTQSGTCPYGARCCFAHGEEELRQVDVMEPAKALCANNLDIVTREAVVSCKKSKTLSENREKDGKCYFKWNSIEKISQVYADWIEDISAPVQLAAV